MIFDEYRKQVEIELDKLGHFELHKFVHGLAGMEWTRTSIMDRINYIMQSACSNNLPIDECAKLIHQGAMDAFVEVFGNSNETLH